MKLNRIAGVLLTTIVCLSTALEAADITSTKLNGCKGPVLCSSFPLLGNCDDCCYTWHLDIGLLYEQATFPGNYAGRAYIPVANQNTATSSAFVEQTVQNLNYSLDYALGLTVSAGYLMHHDQWFIGAKFDWLSTSGSIEYNDINTQYTANPALAQGIVGATGGHGIFQGTPFVPFDDTFDSINYNAGVDIYALDVTLSRGSYLSGCFSYEPWMGVEAIWFTTTSNAQYASTILTNGRSALLNIQFDNWGAGPAFGFNGEYYITEGLSLFSDSNLAVLIGQVQGTATSTLTSGTTASAEPNVVVATNNTDGAYMVPVRSIIGIKLSTFCLEDKHYVAIKLGFDARVIAVIPTIGVPTGLSLNGLYADLIWAF